LSKAPVIDTHAHLTDPSFAAILDQVITRAKSAGLVQIGCIGFDAATSVAACELSDRYPEMLFASVGIQPNSAGAASAEDWELVERLATSNKHVRALGETGLDLYWDNTPLKIQQDFFERHIELSKKTKLPLVIHLRDSGPQIVEQLSIHAKDGAVRGVMHSFTGDKQTCRACLEMGLFISFAGMVTFKKSEELRDIAQYVPADRLLVETDSPYLSPEPLRGKRPNEPSRVIHTLETIAKLHCVTFDEMAHQTTENAKRLFFDNP
jgi:TatD DNase family protein